MDKDVARNILSAMNDENFNADDTDGVHKVGNGKVFFVSTDALSWLNEQHYPFHDITEGVEALYDSLITSINWASGFLDYETAVPIVALAKLLGFSDWEEAQEYIDAKKHAEDVAKANTIQRLMRMHQHLFSYTDKYGLRTSEVCQWPDCNVRKGSEQHMVSEALIAQREGRMEHDHLFSSVGKCMWPKCKEVEK
jgi:hypothetical protein